MVRRPTRSGARACCTPQQATGGCSASRAPPYACCHAGAEVLRHRPTMSAQPDGGAVDADSQGLRGKFEWLILMSQNLPQARDTAPWWRPTASDRPRPQVRSILSSSSTRRLHPPSSTPATEAAEADPPPAARSAAAAARGRRARSARSARTGLALPRRRVKRRRQLPRCPSWPAPCMMLHLHRPRRHAGRRARGT